MLSNEEGNSVFGISLFQLAPHSGENPLSIDCNFRKIRSLGRGAHGFVQLARDKRTQEKVAIKFWPRDAVSINKYVQRELHNHSRFKHPNVIQYKEAFLTPTHLALAMEPALGGDLFKHVRACKGLKEAEARVVFQQLVLAVDYCHKMGVANRDIKLENVLLVDRTSPLRIKLTDFGCCKSDRDSITKTLCGTLGYMAPEVLWGSGPYDAKQVDIWTCGITLYVMLFGRYPFQKKEDMLNWIQFPNRPQVSADVKDLILKMVTRSPDARITLEDICSHSWTSQGLPANYLSKNEEYIRAASMDPHQQSNEDIDRLLLEAGMELPPPIRVPTRAPNVEW